MASIPRDVWDDLERRIRQGPYLENRLPDLREADRRERVERLLVETAQRGRA